MYKLIYANEAANDLQAIYDYIACDDIGRARDYLCAIEKQILRLQDFPNIGHESKYSELCSLGVKILPYDDYLILHIVNADAQEIYIVRVLHGSVNYKRLFQNI